MTIDIDWPDDPAKFPNLKHDVIRDAALWAVGELARCGIADVQIAPGDSTLYKLLIVDRHMGLCGGCNPATDYAADHSHPREALLAHYSDFGGKTYPLPDWRAGAPHWTYVLEKYVRDPRHADDYATIHTAVVLTLFLTALYAAMEP